MSNTNARKLLAMSAVTLGHWLSQRIVADFAWILYLVINKHQDRPVSATAKGVARCYILSEPSAESGCQSAFETQRWRFHCWKLSPIRIIENNWGKPKDLLTLTLPGARGPSPGFLLQPFSNLRQYHPCRLQTPKRQKQP